MIHVAGGRWIGARERRLLLDDHLHAVPDAVYALLESFAERAHQPLTVILERDGEYPAMAALLDELGRARRALKAGRGRRTSAAA